MKHWKIDYSLVSGREINFSTANYPELEFNGLWRMTVTEREGREVCFQKFTHFK